MSRPAPIQGLSPHRAGSPHFSPPPVVEIVGGNQSSKRLLDHTWLAVETEDIAALEQLRKEFISVPENAERCVDEAGNTLVHLAAQRSIGTLRFVVQRLQCDPARANVHGKTALHNAVACNNEPCIEYLLKKEEGTEYAATVSHTLSTAFHTAASCGSVDSMKLLLKCAVEEGKNEEEKVNELDQNKCNALHKCAYDGDIRVAEWLIEEKKINVSQRDFLDTTPLMVAAKVGRLDMCKLLVKHMLVEDIQASDEFGNTALHYAASRCYPELVFLLLEAGSNLEAVNKEVNTPLHLLAIHGNAGVPGWEDMIVTLAASAGIAVLNRQNVFGKTPEQCVNRQSERLFTPEEAVRRAEHRAAKEKAALVAEKESTEKEKQLVSSKRREIEDRQRKLDDEKERLQRESEDRYRQEEDARLRKEEEIERIRQAEEEVKRKKLEKKLAKQKASGKSGRGSARSSGRR